MRRWRGIRTVGFMARPLRIIPPNSTHHVTARGVRQLPVFFDDVDFAYYVELLGRAAVRFGWLVPSYCLIPNHVHLLVFTPLGNLSQGMQWLHGTYGQWFNRRHGLSGHVFDGRFHSKLVEGEEYRLSVQRYIEMNPVWAGLCAHPAQWRWGSHRALMGMTLAPVWLDARTTLGYFGVKPEEARRRYQRFVLDSPPRPP
jgi:REP-associated tyrosine transposase